MLTPVKIKASVLSHGVKLSEELLANFGEEFLEKRRAYGNGDPLSFRHRRIPQELFIDPMGMKLVAAVNVKEATHWRIDYSRNTYYLVDEHENDSYEIAFPLRPAFYEKVMTNKQKVSQLLTLYGGRSLGIFAYGKCQLVEIGKPCHYCSIAQNREKGTDFAVALSDKNITEALREALQDETHSASQVMLNGGNFPEMDKSFLHYIALARQIVNTTKELNSSLETHLIVYPPANLDLLEELKDLDICISINTEIFDAELFKKYCPGKVATAGRDHILKALKKAAAVMGKGRVYSIFVGGLEPLESLSSGLRYLSDIGVTPVINVLHTDPETPLENFPNPSEYTIHKMGESLQQVFETYDHRPFYENCGRNSIDTEAYKQLF